MKASCCYQRRAVAINGQLLFVAINGSLLFVAINGQLYEMLYVMYRASFLSPSISEPIVKVLVGVAVVLLVWELFMYLLCFTNLVVQAQCNPPTSKLLLPFLH